MKKSHLALGLALLASSAAIFHFAWPNAAPTENTALPSLAEPGTSQPAKQPPALTTDPALPAATLQPAPATRTEVPTDTAAPEPKFNPDARLVVLVQDQAGTPVENVAIEWLLELTSTGQIKDQNISGTTDQNGIIEVDRAEKYLDALFNTDQPNPFAGMISRIGLRNTMPFNEYEDESAGVFWLTEDPTPGIPVILTLPPSGWVQFEFDAVKNGAGQQLDTYHLHIRRSDGDYFPGWRDGFPLEPGQTTKRYGPIGLNWEVHASVTAAQVTGGLGLIRAPGPTQAGETITIKIPIGAPAAPLVLATIEGIAQDETGQPLIAQSLNVTLREAPEGSYVGKRITTDKQGHWLLSAPVENLGTTVTLEARSDERKPIAAAPLVRTSATQTHFDQGPMRLVPTKAGKSLIVSGSVLDASGNPIRRVYVTAKAKLLSLDAKPIEDPEALTTIGWVRTHKDGSFEIEALVEYAEATLQVSVSDSDYFSVPAQEAVPGTGGLTFTLTKGSSVTMQIQLEPWVIMTDMVSLRFAGGRISRNPSYGDFLGHYDRHFGGLHPGTYTLTIELSGTKQPLHEQTVEVTGAPVLDLGPIDLRGKLATCNLEVLDPSGAPIPRQYLGLFDPATGQNIAKSSRSSKEGYVNFILPTGSGDLILAPTQSAKAGHGTSISASLFVQPDPGQPPPRTTVTLDP